VHQCAVRELRYLIGPYVTAHAIGDALMAPADLVYGPGKMVQPDLFVIPLVGGAPPRTWMEVGHLILAAEVLSPSTRRTDHGEKRDVYRDKGVPEYWIVDRRPALRALAA
jgi:Uma2 family endonuclease